MPPAAEPPVGIRLAANVLPEQRPPSRRSLHAAPGAAQSNAERVPDPLADVGPVSGASTAERQVRRAIALAELSLLVLDQR